MTTGYIKLRAAQAETTQHVSELKKQREDVRVEVQEIKQKQSHIIDSQHSIEVTVERIETHQENLREEMRYMKAQNAEILRILRGNGGNGQ